MKYEKEMNVYLSNLAILNAKVHGLHWNVKGKEFVRIHLFTEDIYEEFLNYYDDVAELMKMKEANPIINYKDYLKNATIKEVSKKSFTIDEVLKTLKADLGEMIKVATEIRELADKAKDYSIAAAMEDHIKSYEKHLWFVKSIMG